MSVALIKHVPQHILGRIIEQSNGRMISVAFFKKDGSFRRLNGRIGVRVHCKGVRSTQPRMCITLWEAPKPQEGPVNPRDRYRNVRIDRLTGARVDGIEYHAV